MTQKSEAFGTLELSGSKGSYNAYSPSKIIETKSGLRLRDKLGDDHPELAAFQKSSKVKCLNSDSHSRSRAARIEENFEKYVEIPSYVHAEARALKTTNVPTYIARYLNSMQDCRNRIIPDLRILGITPSEYLKSLSR